MFFIESERLKMIPLTYEQLQLWHNSGRAAMENALGLNESNWQVDEFYQKEIDDAMVNFWLPKSLANPGEWIWYTDWEIVLKDQNISVGGMGFNGEPNEQGEAETGYMIANQYQNKGYATEALRLLSGWALAQSGVSAVMVHTYADNMPSVRLLQKSGFAEINRKEDNLLTFKLTKQ